MDIKTTTLPSATQQTYKDLMANPYIIAAFETHLVDGPPTNPSPRVRLHSASRHFYVVGVGHAVQILADMSGETLTYEQSQDLMERIIAAAPSTPDDRVATKAIEARLSQVPNPELESWAKALSKANRFAKVGKRMIDKDLAKSLAPHFAAATLVVGSVGVADAFANDRSVDEKAKGIAWVVIGAAQLASIYEPRLKPWADGAETMVLLTDAIHDVFH